MLTYKYTARDPVSGQKIRAEVQAETEQAAIKLIRSQGLAPLDMHVSGGARFGFGKILNRVKAKDKILFSRQLSTLINAGLPLLQSLRSVADQTGNRTLKVVITQLISDVEGGAAFSAALAKHPEVFNQIYISLVAAGEVSGTLDAALERISLQQEKDAEVVSKVRGAMIYPLIVILVMVAVVGFMLVAVLPQVEELYKGMPGANLPLVTRLLLAVSDLATRFWWILLVILIVLSFFGSRWIRTLGGKSVMDRLKMTLPPINSLFMKMYMARFARTGTTLVASGVPLIQMLEITGEAVSNVHIQASIKNAIEKVKGGKALSECLENDPNFLPLVPNMLKIGEQSGALGDMMAKTADYFEKEVDNQIKTVSTIIEPVLMIILGVVALTIVAAILLPIYGLVGQNVIR
jgi:type IV pilus assembly protein PilC